MRPATMFLGALLLALGGAAHVAAQTQPTHTYPGLAWGFSTGHAGFSTCGTLFLDATGAFSVSDEYSVYGQLSCPTLGGSYASSGNAYFDSGGTFHMTVRLGTTHNLVCDYLPANTLGGQCPIFDNVGNQTGFAVINLL